MATNPTPITRALDPTVLADLGPRRWTGQAACLGVDIDIFFAAENDLDANLQARSYCTDCPVQPNCLNYALDTDQRHGTWGNTTPLQRRHLARRQAA